MEFLTGKDYPWVCEKCRAAIDAAALLFEGDQEDTDDNEAPLMYAGDHGMLCGDGDSKGEQPAYFVEKLAKPYVSRIFPKTNYWGVFEYAYGGLVHATETEQEALEMCEEMNSPQFWAEVKKAVPELAEM